jgi:cytochrome c peroxidase
MKTILLLFFLSVVLFSYESLQEKAIAKGLQSIPKDFATLKSEVDDKYNPLSRDKIILGKQLFFDKNLSLDRTIACATCHDIKKGGVDGKPTAIGYKNRANPNHLNSPTVLNVAYSKHLFWDGRAKSLREQAKGPSQETFEMASTPELIEQRVKENPKYVKAFEQIYGEDAITFDNVTKSIAAYEKILVTRGRYDTFLEGDADALTQQEQRGLNLFIDMGCKACHFGPSVGGQKIQKFPLRAYNSIIDLTTVFDEKTHKRHLSQMSLNFKMYHPYPFENVGGFLGKDQTRYFRVPILRNISKTAPYFHNGVIKTLPEAIKIMAKYQLGIDLTKGQLDALEAFLKSLDGEIVDYGITNQK